MANEARVRQNFQGGSIENDPLLIGGTTLTSAALATVAVIDSTKHMAITLDPEGLGGVPEIAYITAHTSAATTATILRAQEGTTAREHAADVPWSHSPSARDYIKTKYVLGNLAGNHTTTSTSFVDVVTATYDLVIDAMIGDILEMTFDASISGAALLTADFAWSVNAVDKTPYRHVDVTSNPMAISYRLIHPVVSGDLTGSSVRVKPRMKTSTSTLTVHNSASRGPVISVKNLGSGA